MAKDVEIYWNIDLDPWTDVPADAVAGEVVRIGVLPHGTVNGKPVIVFLTELDDEPGKIVVSQITWQQMRRAIVAIAKSPAIVMEDM